MTRRAAMLAWARAHPWAMALAAVLAILVLAAGGLLRVSVAVLLGIAAVAVVRAARGGAPRVAAPGPAQAPAARRGGAEWPFLLLFGAVGAAAAGFGLRDVIAQELQLWGARVVPATVLSTALVEPRARKRRGFNYRPAVRHRYVVDGRVFESDRLYPVGEHLDARYAAALTALYRPGQRVFTRVPAHAPGAAYLAPRRRWIGFGLLVMGLLFLLPAALVARAGLTRRRAASPMPVVVTRVRR